jgi:hypothetical protein
MKVTKGTMSQFVRNGVLLPWVRMLLFVSNALDLNDNKVTIVITNSLKGKFDLTAHCKSAGNDLVVRLFHFNKSF